MCSKDNLNRLRLRKDQLTPGLFGSNPNRTDESHASNDNATPSLLVPTLHPPERTFLDDHLLLCTQVHRSKDREFVLLKGDLELIPQWENTFHSEDLPRNLNFERAGMLGGR